MNQKLKKILTKSLIIFGILIPTVTVSTSLVLSCSSSNNPGGNPEGGNGGSGSGSENGSGGPNGGGSSGGSGSNGGSGTGDSVNQKHVLNFESKLFANPVNGQTPVQYDTENKKAGAIYFESQQKEQELLQLFQDVKDNKIMWINDLNESIRYEFTMTINQGLTIGYGDITKPWDYRTNCYKNVAINGDITIKIPFEVSNVYYDGSAAPKAEVFRYPLNPNAVDTNPSSGVRDGEISTYFIPPLKDWYIFSYGSKTDFKQYSTYSFELMQNVNNKRIFMGLVSAENKVNSNITFNQFINQYNITDASNIPNIFTDKMLDTSRFFVPNDIAQNKFNDGNGIYANGNVLYSQYKFINETTSIGTFSIKQIQ